MSKHIPRHRRWDKRGPAEYQWGSTVVRPEKGAWWAWVSYRQADSDPAGGTAETWQPHCDRLGPFKRPRNAMIAAEEHVRWLTRRHKERIQVDTGLSPP